jgi:hypothetical protein
VFQIKRFRAADLDFTGGWQVCHNASAIVSASNRNKDGSCEKLVCHLSWFNLLSLQKGRGVYRRRD